MKCPECESDNHGTKDSRPREDSIRRRRICKDCGHRWTTYEREETALHGLSVEFTETFMREYQQLDEQDRRALVRIVKAMALEKRRMWLVA